MAEEHKPDQLKLLHFADQIESLERPELKTDWGNDILTEINGLLADAAETAKSAPEIAGFYQG